jgi:hypothetical protein
MRAKSAGHKANSEPENNFEGKFHSMALSPAQVGIAGGKENTFLNNRPGAGLNYFTKRGFVR